MTLTLNRLPIPITEQEQDAFCQPEAILRTKTLQEEFAAGVRWQRIPARYIKMPPQQIEREIHLAQKHLGARITILGHHYQRDDVIQFANFRGDSYLLSKIAAGQKEAEFIVFCGVHFMAETADVLTAPHQKVILPNLAAGCSMADMALVDDVEDAWSQIIGTFGDSTTEEQKQPVIPVTYMNSAAHIKALCGANGGLVCTSSNAEAAMRWAFAHGERIFFLPDQHLGRNTGLKLGISNKEMVVWNPHKSLGGLTTENLKQARLILWLGHCSVHTRFTVGQITEARNRYEEVTILVHPECTNEVVRAADKNGSTEFIRKTVEAAKPGSIWGIGTEISMVNRLAKENPDKTIFCLDPVVCPCATMYRIHPAYLLWVLDGIQAGIPINEIKVAPEPRKHSLMALARMLEIGG